MIPDSSIFRVFGFVVVYTKSLFGFLTVYTRRHMNSGNIHDQMVNKRFVASTTRNKMPPKKIRDRLRQSDVFVPLADHAIVAHHVVPPGLFFLPSSSQI